MPFKRPYFLGYDATTDETPTQVDFPTALQFATAAGANLRTITGGDGNPYSVGDQTVAVRGSKNIVWSSEGYTSTLGVAVPVLTAAQKKATGLQTTNIGGALPLDFSPYRELMLMVNLVSFTGGASPSIQFELDYLDDTATSVNLALWKPAALTAAAASLVAVGSAIPFTQAAAAPTLSTTGFASMVVPAGWTYYPIPLPLVPNGQFAWTVTGAPTAIAWSAWIYGIN